MSIAEELEYLKLKLAQAEIMAAQVTDEELIVDLVDGRTISAPLVWFPRLAYGTPEERGNFQLMRDGIHWPALDEDISVKTLLLGRGLGESQRSLQRWLEQRAHARGAETKQAPITAGSDQNGAMQASSAV
jgi:hypothetical protein